MKIQFFVDVTQPRLLDAEAISCTLTQMCVFINHHILAPNGTRKFINTPVRKLQLILSLSCFILQNGPAQIIA